MKKNNTIVKMISSIKSILTNSKFIIIFSFSFGLLSLLLSVYKNDAEWFQASGAIITIGGVILASRKIIRLGIENFIKDAQTIDGGSLIPTLEEIESDKQFKKDIDAYHFSIWLLILGTFIWAYGGILIRSLDLVTKSIT